MNMTGLQDDVESVYEVKDDETTTQHLVPYTILVHTTVKNKTLSCLLNVILDSYGTATMIKW